ncbi:MAG TPA: DUF998 domain-containing protein [Sediminibacterium sp.]|nr:MAG: hypothetical protein B7Y19_01630 [Sphingobacteriales bacterium 24-40-4]HQR94856.1 DUF998 domain-containing protein [Sediminibacterium sp.]HQS55679.1 DUF998 domain-containing protein [Sediminibacterium sp.]
MKPTKSLAIISFCGLLLFVIIVFALHFLRPDKNLLSCFVSEYAVGNYSWLMTIAFYDLTIASALLLSELMIKVKSSKTSKISLSIFCLGILLTGIYPTDLAGNKPTTGGLIHGLAALIALLNLGISMIAWGISFKKNHVLKNLAMPSLIWGAISLMLLIIFIASPIGFRGLTQRLLLACDISWLLLVCTKFYLLNAKFI